MSLKQYSIRDVNDAHRYLTSIIPEYKELKHFRVDPLAEVLFDYKAFVRAEMSISFVETDLTFLDYLKLHSKIRTRNMVTLGPFNFYYGTWNDFKQRLKTSKFKPNNFLEKSWDKANEHFLGDYTTWKPEQEFLFITSSNGDFFFEKSQDLTRSPFKSFMTLYRFTGHMSACALYLSDIQSNSRVDKDWLEYGSNFSELGLLAERWKKMLQVCQTLIKPPNPTELKSWQGAAWPKLYRRSANYALQKELSPEAKIRIFNKILEEAKANLTNAKIRALLSVGKVQDRLEVLSRNIASDEVFSPEQKGKWTEVEKRYSFATPGIAVDLNSYVQAELDIFALQNAIKKLNEFKDK